MPKETRHVTIDPGLASRVDARVATERRTFSSAVELALESWLDQPTTGLAAERARRETVRKPAPADDVTPIPKKATRS
jgi:hypothetical protein